LEGAPEAYPAKPKKKPKPTRRGAAFILEDAGEILLERRPPSGLLGGMLMPPGSDWAEGDAPDALAAAPADAGWTRLGDVRHVFTHFALELEVWSGTLKGERPDGVWVNKPDAADAGVPSVGKKVLALALSG
ncbi:MAG: NUDIX domain-containing protein, partial [Pseudomonadota bacterium]